MSEFEFEVKDINLAEHGQKKIDWAQQYMPVMKLLYEKYKDTKPFAGAVIAACLHLEAKSANLLITLKKLGAKVVACGSDPLSTQDDVCASLAKNGVHIYSHKNMTTYEYFTYVRKVLTYRPNVIIDDGANLVTMLHQEYAALIPNVKGASEETTSGVKRLRAMVDQDVLKIPVIDVNGALSKYLFDNRYGTGQSVWDGFMRTTNMIVSSKTLVIAGYGWCGRGIASRAAGFGANVVVTEIDPHKAYEALMEGFKVMRMEEAAKIGDIFLTCTGNIHVIRREHIEKMKNNVILGNAGHFDNEINKHDLESLAAKIEKFHDNIVTYVMQNGCRINLLGNGAPTNLACADGHPIEIMDLSLSLQLEAALSVFTGEMDNKTPGLHPVQIKIDKLMVELKLKALGVTIDAMTDEQIEYMKNWQN